MICSYRGKYPNTGFEGKEFTVRDKQLLWSADTEGDIQTQALKVKSLQLEVDSSFDLLIQSEISKKSLQLEVDDSSDLLIHREGEIQTQALKVRVYDSSDHLKERERERERRERER